MAKRPTSAKARRSAIVKAVKKRAEAKAKAAKKVAEVKARAVKKAAQVKSEATKKATHVQPVKPVRAKAMTKHPVIRRTNTIKAVRAVRPTASRRRR